MLIGLLASGCATVQRPAPSVSAPSATVLSPRGCPQFAEQLETSSVRSEDPVVRSLLIEGCRLSPTLRTLVDGIGRTDGVVYILTGSCPVRALRGCLLHTIEDTGHTRYLWIRMTATTHPIALVSTMAHELQHALEVLERTNVRTKRDLLDLYQSVGSHAYGGVAAAYPYRTFETKDAVDVGEAVRAELTNASGLLSPDDLH